MSKPDTNGHYEWVPKDSKIGVMQEVLLARKIGIPQAKLRLFRLKSLSKDDWFHDGQGRYRRAVWCDSGLRKAESALGIKVDRVIPDGETMEVHRSGFKNRRVIQCRRSSGDVVLVRVKDSANYQPRLNTGKPMTVRAKWNGTIWVIDGRGPRFRGRW